MIYIVYGTRAELIKFSTLIRELKERGENFKTIDIGQHNNEYLRKSLKLPKPDHHLGRSYRDKWSRLEASFLTYPLASLLALGWGFKVFLKLSYILSKGNVVVTHGNAMGVPLAIYATRVSGGGKKIVHMESGFRANEKSAGLLDFLYKFADKRSDVLFTPFNSTRRNLKAAYIKGKVTLTGDVMKDVVKQTLKIKPKIRPPKGKYVVANLTRSVVRKQDAKHILEAFKDSPVKIVLVANPVIKKRISNFGMSKLLKSKNILTAPPMAYPDFLHLIKSSIGTVTDSTGVEEECAVLGKPCLVTTDFLQIPELASKGIVRKVGTNYVGLTRGLKDMNNGKWKIRPHRDMGIRGSPTKKIADVLVRMVKK